MAWRRVDMRRPGGRGVGRRRTGFTGGGRRRATSICAWDGGLEEKRRAAAWRKSWRAAEEALGFTDGGGRASPAESTHGGPRPLFSLYRGCGNGWGWSIGDLGAQLGFIFPPRAPQFFDSRPACRRSLNLALRAETERYASATLAFALKRAKAYAFLNVDPIGPVNGSDFLLLFGQRSE